MNKSIQNSIHYLLIVQLTSSYRASEKVAMQLLSLLHPSSLGRNDVLYNKQVNSNFGKILMCDLH